MISGNIKRIFNRIEAICLRKGQNPNEITLVGITKFADISQVNEAVEAGLTHVGENKVQEAGQKFLALGNKMGKVTKHMVGHLQTNKVKQAVEIFDLIESVDSLKLAEAIEKQAADLNKVIDILIQVNTAGEDQKFGITPEETLPLIESISKFEHLRICGLMTVAPLVEDEEVIRKCFRDLRVLRDEVAGKYADDDRVKMMYLSMGMTGDYPIAVEEGSNMVRIGRAIFQDQKG